MRSILFIFFGWLVLIGDPSFAQPFFQLEPDGLYKEDLILKPADWAGFYRTYRKELMIIVPSKDSGIVGLYTINYSNGLLLGTLSGKLKGNGVTFTWTETMIGENSSESGSGFMVMKENKKDVYIKQGDVKMVGNYTAGKKKEIEITSDNVPPEIWLGEWKLDIADNSILTLEPFNEGLMGLYTLKGYKSTTVETSWTTTTFRTTKMPDRTVLILGFPVGKSYYYLTNNYIENDIKTGVITLSRDQKSFSGQEVRSDQLGVKWKNGFSGKR